MNYTTKHGLYGTPEYDAWRGMIDRCENPKSPGFPHYGGRGIKICSQWRHAPEAFLAHVGKRPSPKHQIDRIDNDGNYEPGNVRWATNRQNTNNRRVTVRVSFQGETLPLSNWAERLGLPYDLLADRVIRYGWPADRAFTEPTEQKNRPITYGGKTLSIAGWARHLGLKVCTFRKRVRIYGVPDAFTRDFKASSAEQMRKNRRKSGAVRDSTTGRFIA